MLPNDEKSNDVINIQNLMIRNY